MIRVALIALSMLALAAVAPAAAPPSGFQDTVLTSGLSSPTMLAFAPDGRLFIAEKATGRIRIFKNGVLLATPFADVKTFIPSGTFLDSYSERGLLGVVFDPAFASTGYVYLYYTLCKVPHPGGTPGTSTGCDSAVNRVVRVTASGDAMVAGSQIVLLDGISAAGGNHNGGWMAFGPSDGKLYIAVGENGTPALAQNLGSLNGKILRMNKDGTIPSDNPFVATSGARTEVWALGFRNPFRCAFQPNGSFTLLCADVGQSTWEEINVVRKGANYGWPTTEGMFTASSYPNFTNPIYVYGHQSGQGAAIIGGDFGARTNFPGDYGLSFFFGDYVSGTISRAILDSTATVVQSTQPFIPSATYNGLAGITAGPDRNLYYAVYASGEIHKVIAVTANRSPIAQASATPAQGAPPLAVQFSSAGSSDPDGNPITYSWSFGDGTANSTAANPQHTYAAEGLYTATLTVSDGQSVPGPGTAQVTVTVGTPPVVTITKPVDGDLFSGGDVIQLAGSATDAVDGPIPSAQLHWKVILHHNTHTHPYIDDLVGAPNSFTITTTGETDPDIWYEVQLSATDHVGLTGMSTVGVDPRHATMNLVTTPPNLQLTLDGLPQATPAGIVGVVGIQRTIGAPSPQTSGGSAATFKMWSDNGAQTHVISTPAANTTYTATFTLSSPTTTLSATSTTSTTRPTTTTTSTTLPSSGSCATPIVLPAEGGAFSGVTSGSSGLTGACSSATSASPEQVYRWTAPRSGTATIRTCSTTQTTFDTIAYLRTGSCTTGTDVVCNDDTTGCGTTTDVSDPHRGSVLTPTVVAGQTYYLVIDGYNGAKGSFVFTLTPPSAPATTTTSTVTTTTTSSTTSTIPAGTCTNPVVLPAAGGTITGTTSGTGQLAETCSVGSTAPEKVYQWTPTKTGTATIQTCGASTTTFDTVVALRQDACQTGAEVACNDDTTGCGTTLDGNSPHRGSRITPAVTAGKTYYIVVDGYATSQGTFTLTVVSP